MFPSTLYTFFFSLSVCLSVSVSLSLCLSLSPPKYLYLSVSFVVVSIFMPHFHSFEFNPSALSPVSSLFLPLSLLPVSFASMLVCPFLCLSFSFPSSFDPEFYFQCICRNPFPSHIPFSFVNSVVLSRLFVRSCYFCISRFKFPKKKNEQNFAWPLTKGCDCPNK